MPDHTSTEDAFGDDHSVELTTSPRRPTRRHQRLEEEEQQDTKPQPPPPTRGPIRVRVKLGPNTNNASLVRDGSARAALS